MSRARSLRNTMLGHDTYIRFFCPKRINKAK